MVIRADVGVLSAEAGRLGAVCDELRERVGAARGGVGDLLDEGWSGESAAAFRGAFDLWVTAADESVQELERLVEALRAAAADVARQEEDVQTVVRGLEGGLSIPNLGALMGGGS